MAVISPTPSILSLRDYSLFANLPEISDISEVPLEIQLPLTPREDLCELGSSGVASLPTTISTA